MNKRDPLDPEDPREGVVQLSQEAQNAATRASEAAGMSVSEWLSQLIKYAGTMEQNRRGLADDGGDSDAETTGSKHESSLFGGDGDHVSPVMVPINAIRPNQGIARTEEDEQAVQTCLSAYRETGDFPPLTVRRVETIMGNAASLEIVSGEQRWRAALRAKLTMVPVFIQNCSDKEALVFSVREAKRRYKVAPLMEARCYVRLMKSFNLSVSDIAEAVGESADQVTDALNLLTLPTSVQKMVEDGVISRMHAKALLQADDPEAIAWDVAGRGLDIFQTEQMIRNAKAPAVRTRRSGNGDE